MTEKSEDIAWNPKADIPSSPPPPPLPVEKEVSELMSVGGVTRLIVPTIMQCNQGGYLVVIPNLGTFAASTLEEIMQFVEQKTMDHFKTKPSEFPRVVRERLSKVKEGVFDTIKENAKRIDAVMVAIIAAGLLIGWTIFGGFNDTERDRSLGAARSPPKGSSLSGDLGSSRQALEPRPAVLPEVHVRRVRTTPDDREAQRLLQDSEVRGMLPPH